MAEIVSKKMIDEMAAEHLRKNGYPFTAKYIEMFGHDNLNPAFPKREADRAEEFYKKCVEEGHPWDWYYEFPDDSIF